MQVAATSITPLFIQSSKGRVFAIYHALSNNLVPAETLIYLPPFAEEMNRSRRMASLQAQALAALGLGVLLLDLFGTGDSEGDFSEATWDGWLDDVRAAANWIEARGSTRISLWGLRFGGLLASAAAACQPARFRRLLLWQPIADGKAFMTQFLRIRLAASLGGNSGETTETLRGILASGTSIEVAGYELAPNLVSTLDQLKLADIQLQPKTKVSWLEAVRKAGDPLLPASRRVVDLWRKAGIDVKDATAVGDPFWNIQETTVSLDFIDATTSIFEAHSVP